MKNVILILSIGSIVLSCGDGSSSSNAKENKNLKEFVIERYSAGDKKIVGFYDGEGSNEVIVKRVHYYSQNDGGGKEKEENYKNGKLEGKYYEWRSDGNKSIDCSYKNGELEGKCYKWGDYGWRGLPGIFVLNYKNGRLHDTCKTYHSSGELNAVGIFKDGRGIEYKQYTNGQLSNHLQFNLDGATINVIKGKDNGTHVFDFHFPEN